MFFKAIPRAVSVYFNLMNNELYMLFMTNFLMKNKLIRHVSQFYLNLGFCGVRDDQIEHIIKRFKESKLLDLLIFECSGNEFTSEMYPIFESLNHELSNLCKLEVRCKLDTL